MDSKVLNVERPGTVYGKIKVFLEMIKFSHTIFALPFAFMGAVIAAAGIPSLYQTVWILMAMVGARTAAMGLNRIIDAEIDGRNPRTSGRAIPAGMIAKPAVWGFIIISTALMFFAAYMLNPMALYLSPVALFFLVLYSFCKRFTSMAHMVLGLCLAAAPVGAWIAIRGSVDLPAIIIGLAVLFWVAGFDILYALQDLDFDRKSGLHSVPVKLGVNGSLWMARVFHLIMIALLVILPSFAPLGEFFWAGLAVSAGMIFYEHWLLRGGDLTRLDAAFFNMNGYISVTLFSFTFLDIVIR